jgi:hypothetical protein
MLNQDSLNETALNELSETPILLILGTAKLRQRFRADVAIESGLQVFRADIAVESGLQVFRADIGVSDFQNQVIDADVKLVGFETQVIRADVEIQPEPQGNVIHVGKGTRLL